MKLFKISSSIILMGVASASLAHTNSIGYTEDGGGAYTFWYGNWHDGTTFTEGSLELSGSTGTTTSAFTSVTGTQPTGLIPGTNYFTSNGTKLVAYNTSLQKSTTWQGVTVRNLVGGRYTYTYKPIANPTADWEPMDSVILSGILELTSSTPIITSLPNTSRGRSIEARNSMISSFDLISSRFSSMRTGLNGGSSGDDFEINSNLWLKPFGGGMSQTSRGGSDGYSGDTWGLAGGYDYDFNKGLTTGLGFSYTKTGIEYANGQARSGDSSGIQSYQISIYGNQKIGSAYVEAIGAWARQDYSNQRDTQIAGIIANSNYNGQQWGARLGGGIPLQVHEETMLTPIVRLDWNKITESSYTEKDGGAFNYNVGRISADRLRSTSGVELDSKFKLFNITAQPFLHAFWNYDIFTKGANITTKLSVGTTNAVTLSGQNLYNHSATVGAGINFLNHKDISASVAYDVNLGEGYVSHIAQATFRYNF